MMQYDTLASADAIAKTISALGERNIEGMLVSDRAGALEKIKKTNG